MASPGSTQTEVINIGVPKGPIPLGAPRLHVTATNDVGTIRLNQLPPPVEIATPTKSVNFGPGASLLMNRDRVRAMSPKSDIQLSDLQSLERDNKSGQSSMKEARRAALSSIPMSPGAIGLGTRPPTPGGAGRAGVQLNITEINPQMTESKPAESNLGSSTSQKETKEKTWDGYKKFNEIPVNPNVVVSEKPTLTSEETLREKFRYIRRLDALEKKGIAVSKKYTMDDKLEEMKGEFEMIKSDQEKRSAVKFQGKMLMAFVSAIEFLNGKFDPLDIKLDGWGDAVNENIDEYDDVFGELHEKYGGKAKMAPELKLLFMLGGSAVMVHMTNTMFKSSMPGMDDIMRQNPELMQQFTQAAVNSMGQRNPGLGGFMSGVMGQGVTPPMGSPPGPVQGVRAPRNMEPSNRPDIRMARGHPTFDDAENMENRQARVPPTQVRNEMRGPKDIGDLLSGIKTKRVNIRPNSDNKSTISVEDLPSSKDGVPRKSKRKPRSERNTMNLNI